MTEMGAPIATYPPGGTATNISVTADPAAQGPQAIGAYMSNVGRVAGEGLRINVAL